MSDFNLSSKIRRERILAVSTGGICIATAFVLSWIKIFTMPQGGSVTPASMLPIFFFALCFGPAWGFGAAFVFSLLQLIGGYFIMPVQILLDYTLAYTALGVAGFFAAPREIRIECSSILARLSMIPVYKMVLSVLLGISLRMLCSLLSGVYFFAEYAGTENPWIYSVVYNGAYLLPEAILTIFILIIVMLATRAYRPRKKETVATEDFK